MEKEWGKNEGRLRMQSRVVRWDTDFCLLEKYGEKEEKCGFCWGNNSLGETEVTPVEYVSMHRDLWKRQEDKATDREGKGGWEGWRKNKKTEREKWCWWCMDEKTGKNLERVFEKEGRGLLTRETASRELEGWKQGVATSPKSQYSGCWGRKILGLRTAWEEIPT